MPTQKRYSAQFKLEVVEEFLRGDKGSVQIARERGIDITSLRTWRRDYEQHGAEAWPSVVVPSPANEDKIAQLERVIGQLTVENLVLKKALTQVRSASKLGTLSSTS